MRRMIPRSSNVSCLKGLRGGRDAPEDISIQCSQVPLQTKFADVNNLPYTQRMVLVTKTATIQVRVVPVVKAASERVLWRIGLNMSEAIELFLRRVIVEERLPFEVIALNPTQIGSSRPSVQQGRRARVWRKRSCRKPTSIPIEHPSAEKRI